MNTFNINLEPNQNANLFLNRASKVLLHTNYSWITKLEGLIYKWKLISHFVFVLKILHVLLNVIENDSLKPCYMLNWWYQVDAKKVSQVEQKAY